MTKTALTNKMSINAFLKTEREKRKRERANNFLRKLRV